MEPVSAPPAGAKRTRKGKQGSLENPEVLENVPGHVIPILEREFDDFDTEAEKFLDGRDAEERVHRLPAQAGRLRPAPGRRPDDPREAPLRRHHPGADGGLRRRGREVRAAEQGPHHDAPEHPDAPRAAARRREADPRARPTSGLSSREGCGNTVRNVTGDPWAGVCEDELFDPTPYAGAYVRYFVRHPTTQLMPRKVKTAFTATDEDRAITGIHDIGFIPRDQGRREGLRDARRRRHVDHAARRADALRLRRRRRRRVPEGHRGRVPRSSTARTGCASTAPARASRSSSTSSASTSCATRSRRS